MDSNLVVRDLKKSQLPFFVVFLVFLFFLIKAQAESDTLPDALLGNAGPLSGTPVQYYLADLSSVGYLAAPDGEGPLPSCLLYTSPSPRD